MSKDPAFLFYPGNWQGGTITMSRHLKGCYIDLLVAQFNSGPLSLEDIKTVLGNDFAAWGALSKKFAVDETGKYFNERLEAEKKKRIEFSNKQIERIKKRWNKNGIDSGNTAVLPKISISNSISNSDLDLNEKKYSKQTEKIREKNEKLFSDLNEFEMQNSIEYLDRVIQKKFEPPELNNFFQAFKIQYVNDPYQNRTEVLKHFRNWIKNQNNGHSAIKNGNGTHKLGTSAARIEALKNW